MSANAPRPDNPLDPRSLRPSPLPHNSGETWTVGGKVTVPFGQRFIGRLFGIDHAAVQGQDRVGFAPHAHVDGPRGRLQFELRGLRRFECYLS